jgi:competence ComEA-like helix-hairpin-helix protein
MKFNRPGSGGYKPEIDPPGGPLRPYWAVFILSGRDVHTLAALAAAAFVVLAAVTASSASTVEAKYFSTEDFLPFIDLNAATVDELVLVPLVGDKRAADIAAYRDGVGRIADIEELRKVSGIGDKTIENLKAYCFIAEGRAAPREDGPSPRGAE